MRVSVNRVAAVLEVGCAVSFAVVTHWFDAGMLLVLAGYMWVYDNADHERRELRKGYDEERTTTTTTTRTTITFKPGDGGGDGWADVRSLRKPS